MHRSAALRARSLVDGMEPSPFPRVVAAGRVHVASARTSNPQIQLPAPHRRAKDLDRRSGGDFPAAGSRRTGSGQGSRRAKTCASSRRGQGHRLNAARRCPLRSSRARHRSSKGTGGPVVTVQTKAEFESGRSCGRGEAAAVRRTDPGASRPAAASPRRADARPVAPREPNHRGRACWRPPPKAAKPRRTTAGPLAWEVGRSRDDHKPLAASRRPPAGPGPTGTNLEPPRWRSLLHESLGPRSAEIDPRALGAPEPALHRDAGGFEAVADYTHHASF
jgi:hypothetical protein